MPEILPSQLVTSVMAKLYDVLTNGDETVPASADSFFSWATPGVPMSAEDFEFAARGLTGVVKRPPTPEGQQPEPLTSAELETLRAQDAAGLYQQAEAFARLVDVAVKPSAATNDAFARLNILSSQGSLSDRYRYCLRMSQVLAADLEPEVKANIERLRGLLQTEVTKKDILSGAETTVKESSELTKAYFAKLVAYEDAVLAYNSSRISALAGTSAAAVQDFAINGGVRRNKVKAALADWVNNGYKDDYEKIAAYISQVSGRDMSLLKAEYLDDLEKARLTGPASGSDFFYTTLVPGNFATSSGWTKFTFTGSDVTSDTSSAVSTRKWNASGGASFLGIFGGKGAAGSTSERSEYTGTFNSDNVSVSFEIAQVHIVYPWLRTAFLASNAWRFDPSLPDNEGLVVSDGKTPPDGLIPAYPEAAIFIRNLTMSVGHSESFSSFVSEHTSKGGGGGGFLTIGGFFGGGDYSRKTTSGTTTNHVESSYQNQTLEVAGLQFAGLKCVVNTDLMPHPHAAIEHWV